MRLRFQRANSVCLMPELFLSLCFFAAVATVTPGGATLLAAASGTRFGFRRSVPLLAGLSIGLASLMAAAAIGLAALLQSAPALQLIIKAVGSAYLFWLAWKIAQSGAPDTNSGAAAAPVTFSAGLVLLWLNPKGWTMAFAAAAAYAELASSPLQIALLLGTVFGLAAVSALSLWCASGLVLGRTLRTERHWKIANMVLGLLLAASIVPMWL